MATNNPDAWGEWIADMRNPKRKAKENSLSEDQPQQSSPVKASPTLTQKEADALNNNADICSATGWCGIGGAALLGIAGFLLTLKDIADTTTTAHTTNMGVVTLFGAAAVSLVTTFFSWDSEVKLRSKVLNAKISKNDNPAVT